ncbi:hypothetical protein LXL04_015669 [Taraxacum kok-saghyz]
MANVQGYKLCKVKACQNWLVVAPRATVFDSHKNDNANAGYKSDADVVIPTVTCKAKACRNWLIVSPSATICDSHKSDNANASYDSDADVVIPTVTSASASASGSGCDSGTGSDDGCGGGCNGDGSGHVLNLSTRGSQCESVQVHNVSLFSHVDDLLPPVQLEALAVIATSCFAGYHLQGELPSLRQPYVRFPFCMSVLLKSLPLKSFHLLLQFSCPYRLQHRQASKAPLPVNR